MKNSQGFSLVELLIVVGIILTISAIAIPNLIKAKIAANEASAVASLHSLVLAETAFASACPSIGFTQNLDDLATAATCPGGNNQIDSGLASGTKSGYSFTLSNATGTPAATFAVNADPLSSGSGTRHFYVDQSAVVRFNWSAAATSTDSALQ
jgi:type IV pilus assembly protein PilA